jgi:hypothetical protein
MERGPVARLIRAGAAALALVLATQLPAVAQSQGDQITICHRTGSEANPWVFMTIAARDWPEFEARGDVRANSLADCAPPTPAPTAAPTNTPAPTATPQAAANPLARGPQVAPFPARVASAAELGAEGTQTPVATNLAPASPVPTVEVASASATVDASATQASTGAEVSTLPRSGGEPDRPLLVLALLGVGSAGLLLRYLAQRAGHHRRRHA